MPTIQPYTRQVTPTAQTGYVPQSAAALDLETNRALIDATAQAAQIATGLSEKMREADHVANYAKASTTLMEAQSQFKIAAAQDPDNYAKHEQSYNEQMLQIKDSLLAGITDPISRNNINQALDKSIFQGQLDIRELSTSQKLDLNLADLNSSADMLYSAGKYDEANKLIEAGMSTGLLSRVRGQAIIDSKTAESKYSIAQARAREYIAAGGDPLKFLDKNTNLGLNMAQREQIQAYAMQFDTWMEQEQAEAKRQKIEEGQKQFYNLFNDNKVTPTIAKNMLANGEIDVQDYNYAYRVWESRAQEARREREAAAREAKAEYKEQQRWRQLGLYLRLKDKQINGTLTDDELADSAGALGLDNFKSLTEAQIGKGPKERQQEAKAFNMVMQSRNKQVDTLLQHRAGVDGVKIKSVDDLPKDKRNQYYNAKAQFQYFAQTQINQNMHNLNAAEKNINDYINQLNNSVAKEDSTSLWDGLSGIDWRGTTIMGIPLSSTPAKPNQPAVHVQLNAPTPPPTRSATVYLNNPNAAPPPPMNKRNVVIQWGQSIDPSQFQAD